MDIFLQQILNGLLLGSIYALVALGFSLIFAVSGYLNLVQGEFVVLGGLITIALTDGVGMPLVPAVVLAVLVSAVLGLILQQLTNGLALGMSYALVALGLLLNLGPRDIPRRIAEACASWPVWAWGAIAGAAVVAIDAMGPEGVAPFIYFQF